MSAAERILRALNVYLKIVGAGWLTATAVAMIPPKQNEEKLPKQIPPESNDAVAHDDYVRSTEYFFSEDTKCEGWLYLPKQPRGINSQLPVVLMAHGMGSQKDFTLSRYAKAFAKCGIATFAFDYRCFGGSDGVPRNWHVKQSKHGFSRIGLWGTSFSGGHVLVAASKAPADISCVVSQVPYLDMRMCMGDVVRSLGFGHLFRSNCAALRDLLGDIFLNRPYYLPLVANPGEWGVLTGSDCVADFDRFMTLSDGKPRGGWQPYILARIGLTVLRYRPFKHLKDVQCPLFIIAAGQDTLCPISAARKAAEVVRAARQDEINDGPSPEFKFWEIDCRHFDPYFPPLFNQVVEQQATGSLVRWLVFFRRIKMHDVPELHRPNQLSEMSVGVARPRFFFESEAT